MRKFLVTGGAGFIGCNFVRRHFDAHPRDAVLVFDALTYAGDLENLSGLDHYAGYRFVRGDVAERAEVEAAFDAAGPIDVVVHFAAESHVDRSIYDPTPFVRANIVGTQTVLEVARRRGAGLFVQVSTDEVYGALDVEEPPFTEERALLPNSPYAASKAAADCMARAYAKTYELPVIITRCSNNYGPYQFPEKFLPLFITNALEDRPLPLYGDGLHARDWLHVHDHCDAIEAVVDRGRAGEVYNIGGRCERRNLDVARAVCRVTGRAESLIRFVSDRRGHDRRYSVDTTKIERELGWRPGRPIEESLGELVRWYAEHRGWWDAIKSGAYREYYDRMYGATLRRAD